MLNIRSNSIGVDEQKEIIAKQQLISTEVTKKKFKNKLINANIYNFSLSTNNRSKKRKNQSKFMRIKAELKSKIPHLKINYKKLIDKFGKYRE